MQAADWPLLPTAARPGQALPPHLLLPVARVVDPAVDALRPLLNLQATPVGAGKGHAGRVGGWVGVEGRGKAPLACLQCALYSIV